MLIRHAKATVNEAYGEAFGNHHKEMEVVTDLNHLDSGLSDRGIEQAKETAEIAAKLTKFSTVLVSPMKRALESSYLFFKDTPYFNSLNFVILPVLRDPLHSVGDIPENW